MRFHFLPSELLVLLMVHIGQQPGGQDGGILSGWLISDNETWPSAMSDHRQDWGIAINSCHSLGWHYNTLRSRQNGRQIPDDNFECIFFDENI